MNGYDEKTIAYLLKNLKAIILPERWHKFEHVLSHRTRYITLVLENLFQAHNSSAVIRTCDCLGIQDLHIIENDNEYIINPDIVVGSNKWVNIYNYTEKKHNTLLCFENLKSKGYQIVATSPHVDGYLLNELPLDKKTALVFGNEGHGLSDIALQHADAFVKIPMYGFTESYNISVSAALCMYELGSKLRKSQFAWQLSEAEKNELLIEFALKTIRNPEIFKRKLLRDLNITGYIN